MASDPEKTLAHAARTSSDAELKKDVGPRLSTYSAFSNQTDSDPTSPPTPVHDDTHALTPQLSRVPSGPALSRKATSIRTAATTKDPDFEIDWGGDDDLENPTNWPLWYKSLIILEVSFGTVVVVLYSTAYTSGIFQMEDQFNVHSEPVITLGVTMYLIGLAVGSLLLAPISELFGRKPVYVVCMFCFVLLIIPCGFSTSLTEVLVARFFGAIAGSAMIANAPGTLNDIVTEEYRALAFSVWSLGPLNGPVLGPVLGGFTSQYLGFRWANWIVMVLAAISWLSTVFIRETYPPVLLSKRAARRRRDTGDERWWCRYEQRDSFWTLLRINLTRPFVMAITEPICIFWNIYIAIIYGIMYMCFVAYPIVFTGLRGWSIGFSGLSFAGLGIGGTIVIVSEPLLRRLINRHPKDPATGRVQPEASVAVVCIAAFLAPIGQLWFAWTCTPPVHWIWPILAGIPFGAGNSAVFIYASSYLTGSYGIYTASALAGNAVVRSMMGGTLPLLGPIMYTNLGPHWAGSLLGFLQILIIPIPLAFYKYGGKIREKSVLISKMRADKQRLDGKRARQKEDRERDAADVERQKGERDETDGEREERAQRGWDREAAEVEREETRDRAEVERAEKAVMGAGMAGVGDRELVLDMAVRELEKEGKE